MEIDNLHINQQDFNLFKTLKPKDKIEFLYDAQFLGKELSIHKAISKNESIKRPSNNPILNEIFQDTLFDELRWNNDRLTIIISNRMVHLNSTSLRWIRSMVNKLFSDGHILIRNKNAKKLSEVDIYRFYRCYDIVGSGDPLCLN